MAFRKKMTFEEFAKETGKPMRSVQMELAKSDVHLMRRLLGLGDFDVTTEALDFLQSLWG
jgi:hypothetical protein